MVFLSGLEPEMYRPSALQSILRRIEKSLGDLSKIQQGYEISPGSNMTGILDRIVDLHRDLRVGLRETLTGQSEWESCSVSTLKSSLTEKLDALGNGVRLSILESFLAPEELREFKRMFDSNSALDQTKFIQEADKKIFELLAENPEASLPWHIQLRKMEELAKLAIILDANPLFKGRIVGLKEIVDSARKVIEELSKIKVRAIEYSGSSEWSSISVDYELLQNGATELLSSKATVASRVRHVRIEDSDMRAPPSLAQLALTRQIESLRRMERTLSAALEGFVPVEIKSRLGFPLPSEAMKRSLEEDLRVVSLEREAAECRLRVWAGSTYSSVA